MTIRSPSPLTSGTYVAHLRQNGQGRRSFHSEDIDKCSHGFGGIVATGGQLHLQHPFLRNLFSTREIPDDTVIFTRGMPLEKFKRNRPREHEASVAAGKLEENLMAAPSPLAVRIWRRPGFTALAIGLALIGLILCAMISAYR